MGVKLNMKSFVAVLACVASASAAVVPAAYNGYAYPYAYGYTAAAPVANVAAYHHAAPLAQVAPVSYAAAPAVYGGAYAGVYDPSVAYANAYPLAEPYVHEEIAAEAYVDAQIEAEPYVHEEIAAEPYVDVQIPAEAYVHQEPIAVAAPVAYAQAPVAYAQAPVAY